MTVHYTKNKEKAQDLDRQIMLYINRRLFEQRHITEEMYHKAKEEFLRFR